MTTSTDAAGTRTTWSLEAVQALLDRPLLELVFEAAETHRRHHDAGTLQCSQLLSIKTGGCPEDCSYC
jgi:biotin synthase